MRSALIRSSALAATLLACGSTFASLITVTGDITLLDPPPADVSQNALESNSTMYAFQEQENLILTNDIRVNAIDPGLYDDTTDLVIGNLPKGIAVNSYFVTSDRNADEPGFPDLSGTMTFENDILGVIVLSTDLTTSDSDLGAAGTLYTTGVIADQLRGLELRQGLLDSIEISPDRRTITINARSILARDQIRIVTAVPEPASLGLIVLGGVIAAFSRRQKIA